ncbi:outer membrane lipoprotein LolB [Pseudoduganella armeniaca]|uniref:Outer-membrane lipoprotein LolB n=1 Tax=Pseudoduganella armeniaca TaxID=2072590 RepID=A0A2R4CGY7_9BURK|nr:outer membrane lipoprotein LolB [Pseudoduganella armeniaca]AVR98718.1 outer membrane lipoprotein LolB [Pseudoduganella armeniaca]
MKHPISILLLGSALLAGCATTPTGPLSTVAVAPYRETVALEGSLSVNYVKEGKRESLSGKFTWQQQGPRTDVTLSSPLGQQIAAITVTPQQAVYHEGSKPPRSAPNIDTLSAQTLGWPLPVSGLRDWLQGYATAAGGVRFAASPANNTVTTADGWQLQFDAWQEEGATPQPRRIIARRGPGGDIEEIEIRIALRPAASAS